MNERNKNIQKLLALISKSAIDNELLEQMALTIELNFVKNTNPEDQDREDLQMIFDDINKGLEIFSIVLK
jgi:hypothetical protein